MSLGMQNGKLQMFFEPKNKGTKQKMQEEKE
jgi:hypothetical protein